VEHPRRPFDVFDVRKYGTMRATAVRTPILILPVGGTGMNIGVLREPVAPGCRT
jgi:hypothetical protein